MATIFRMGVAASSMTARSGFAIVVSIVFVLRTLALAYARGSSSLGSLPASSRSDLCCDRSIVLCCHRRGDGLVAIIVVFEIVCSGRSAFVLSMGLSTGLSMGPIRLSELS